MNFLNNTRLLILTSIFSVGPIYAAGLVGDKFQCEFYFNNVSGISRWSQSLELSTLRLPIQYTEPGVNFTSARSRSVTFTGTPDGNYLTWGVEINFSHAIRKTQTGDRFEGRQLSCNRIILSYCNSKSATPCNEDQDSKCLWEKSPFENEAWAPVHVNGDVPMFSSKGLPSGQNYLVEDQDKNFVGAVHIECRHAGTYY